MNKIPCLFERTFSAKGKPISIGPGVTPGCEWVMAGEGIATRKHDGTACAVIDGKLFKRLDIKRLKVAPLGWLPCARLEDSNSKPGWFPVGDGPEDQWHREAWAFHACLEDGTYELCGPKLQGNPERLEAHRLIRHGCDVIASAPRTLEDLREFLRDFPGEGIVFHRPAGCMAKIRRDDFGFAWPIK